MALQFPLDTKEINYQAKVSFTPITIEAIDVEGLFKGAGQAIINTFTTDVDETPVGPQPNNVKKRADAEFDNNADLETVKGTGQRGKRGETVTLFLPQAIQINDRADYENISLGILGASTAEGMRQGENLIPTVVKSVGASVNSMIDAIVGGGSLATETGRLATTRASSLIPNSKVRGAVRSGSRVAVNPNTRALFKEIPLREFTFTFKMIPTSYQESVHIKQIVKFFRTELYPSLINIAETDIPAGYEMPNVFDIKMFYKNESKQLATKILPSYLRNFTATYNSSSQAFFEGGDFTEVDISMSFVESSTLHKKLVSEENY